MQQMVLNRRELTSFLYLMSNVEIGCQAVCEEQGGY